MDGLIEITVFATGITIPYIQSGTTIIKIEDGEVTVGRLNYDLNESWSLEIEHPKNENELKEAAKERIKKSKPEYLKSREAIIVTCPADLEVEMNW